MNRANQQSCSTEVDTMVSYLSDKKVIGFNRKHDQAVIDLVQRTIDEELKNTIKIEQDKNLSIQFESNEQLLNTLKCMSIKDIIKIKYLNKKNKVIDIFFDTLSKT